MTPEIASTLVIMMVAAVLTFACYDLGGRAGDEALSGAADFAALMLGVYFFYNVFLLGSLL